MFLSQLVDDDFEEHVLEHSPDKYGLYLHGINENTAEFSSRSMEYVSKIAHEFGFYVPECIVISGVDELVSFAEDGMKNGTYEGKPVEGFVIRSRDISHYPSKTFFFKVKFEEPYLVSYFIYNEDVSRVARDY